MIPPCDQPCPKCGSTDIRRAFMLGGEKIDLRYSERYKRRINEFVHISGGGAEALKDHIAHRCRVCGYDWEGATLESINASNEAMVLEPDGGNVYRPHKLMITSGQFWRCAHGSTGLGDGGIWVGCADCQSDDPEAYAKWEGDGA